MQLEIFVSVFICFSYRSTLVNCDLHLHVHVNAINIPEQLLSAYELLLQTESERNIDITISPFLTTSLVLQ